MPNATSPRPPDLRRALHLLILLLSTLTAAAENLTTTQPAKTERGFAYTHDEKPEVPWSIHILKLDLRQREFDFGTSLGAGSSQGMSTVPEQMKALPPALGTPLAAVNGDFYNDERNYVGDPRDLQIRDGELISAPDGHACLWFDAAGKPQFTNIVSRFRVLFPDGSSMPFGLNEAREHEAVVLYTAANGTSTRTRGGREFVLEAAPGSAWLPLRVGQVVKARVREVRETGDTPLSRDSLVLSLGYKLAANAKAIVTGDILTLTPATFPDLTGATTALGGGPTLVRNGKAGEWSGFQPRHPRTALGWNKDHFFLVVVDGRQKISAGMTLEELAGYMVKLGCDQAMNLDGGGSTTMWILGQVVNSPSEGRERPGANSLVVFRRPGPDQAVRRP